MQEHFDVGLVADSLLRGQGTRGFDIGGRQAERDRPSPGAGGGLFGGKRGPLQDAAFCGPLQRPPAE